VADCARGWGSAGVRPASLRSSLLLKNLRVVFSGYQQKPSPALVRHDALRESGEGTEVLREEEGALSF
jgi:hypothetical protein